MLDKAFLASLSLNTFKTSIAFCECSFISSLVNPIPGPSAMISSTYTRNII